MKKHPLHTQLCAIVTGHLEWIPELYGVVLLDATGHELFFMKNKHTRSSREAILLANIAPELLVDVITIQKNVDSAPRMIFVRYQCDKTFKHYAHQSYSLVIIMPVGDIAYLFLPLESHPKFGYSTTLERLYDSVYSLLEECI